MSCRHCLTGQAIDIDGTRRQRHTRRRAQRHHRQHDEDLPAVFGNRDGCLGGDGGARRASSRDGTMSRCSSCATHAKASRSNGRMRRAASPSSSTSHRAEPRTSMASNSRDCCRAKATAWTRDDGRLVTCSIAVPKRSQRLARTRCAYDRSGAQADRPDPYPDLSGCTVFEGRMTALPWARTFLSAPAARPSRSGK